MAYTLISDTWENLPIAYCVMVAEDGTDPDDVVNVSTSGESQLDNYGTASGKSVTTGRTWGSRILSTFRTSVTNGLMHGWEIASADRYTFAGPWHSVFIAAYDLDPPTNNPGYGNIWGNRDVGKGIGLNTSSNLVYMAGNQIRGTSSAVVTTTGPCSVGLRHKTVDPAAGFWYVEGDAPTAIDTLDSNFSSDWAPEDMFATHVNGQPGNTEVEAFIILVVDGQLTGPLWQRLHNDFFGELISAPAPSGSAAPGLRANPRLILP